MSYSATESRSVVRRLSNLRRLFLGVVLATLGISFAQPATGYVLNPSGCKWAGTDPSISYSFQSVTVSYATAHNNGASAWNATASPGSFFEGGGNQVLVYDDYYGSNGFHAWVGGGCGANKIWNPPLTLYYNQSYMDAFSANKKKATAVHELGHVYGLAHPNHWDCHDQLNHGAIMLSGAWAWDNCSWNTPKVDDVAGVNFIY
jgi:hypothetical protein